MIVFKWRCCMYDLECAGHSFLLCPAHLLLYVSGKLPVRVVQLQRRKQKKNRVGIIYMTSAAWASYDPSARPWQVTQANESHPGTGHPTLGDRNNAPSVERFVVSMTG